MPKTQHPKEPKKQQTTYMYKTRQPKRSMHRATRQTEIRERLEQLP
jgi:hypothetical protein